MVGVKPLDFGRIFLCTLFNGASEIYTIHLAPHPQQYLRGRCGRCVGSPMMSKCCMAVAFRSALIL